MTGRRVPRRRNLRHGEGGPLVMRSMWLPIGLNRWLETEARRLGHRNVSALIRALLEEARGVATLETREEVSA